MATKGLTGITNLFLFNKFINDTDDAPYTFENRIGVFGFDGLGYPYIIRQSESLGDDTLEVYTNEELDGTGNWSEVASIGPLPCTGVVPDIDRGIIFENNTNVGVLMYCPTGYLILASSSDASAAPICQR